MVDIHENSSSQASQTYVFKVNINCCKYCPKILEKALQERLHGIESAKVDARKSLVTVKGSMDSKAVIDQIKKWRKKAELVPEREDTNPYGYTVESNDRDEGEKEDLFNASSRHEDSSSHHEDSSCHQKDSSVRHEDSSSRQKDSSVRHEDSSSRQKDSSSHQKDSSVRHEDSSAHQKYSSARHKKFFSLIRRKNKGSGNAPKKNDNSESSASSPKEIPDHICRDKHCTSHKRDNNTTSDHVPNVNNGTGHPSLHHGSGNNNPMMNPYVQRPPMYAPPPLHYQGQYAPQRPRMVPPMAGYGSYAMQRQMPRPMSNGFTDYPTDVYSNGCNNM